MPYAVLLICSIFLLNWTIACTTRETIVREIQSTSCIASQVVYVFPLKYIHHHQWSGNVYNATILKSLEHFPIY